MTQDVPAAEKSVLGGILLQASALEEVSDIVRPADFMAPLHEEIYAAMLVMHEEGVPIDVLTVSDRLSGSPMLSRAGGVVYLHDMVTATPTASNVAWYAGIVAQDGARRRLHMACVRGAQLTEAGIEAGMTSAEMREVVMAEVDASMTARATVQFADALAQEYLAGLDAPVSWVPTPWPSLNYLIGGWAPGRLYILAARPGVGKSLMGFQAATELSLHGNVSISSLEMGRMEVMQRIIANKADVSMNSLLNHRLTQEERWRVEAAAAEMTSYRLAVDDRTNVQPLDIGAHARSVARRGPLSAVVVDYMQLMSSATGSKAPRQEQVAEMSRQLKLLSRSLEVPVLALSQLNRGPEQRGGLPTLADLRESGAIEQDADVVIMMSMARETDETGTEIESTSVTKVQVAKNRHGQTGVFDLYREGEYARFRQPARPDQRVA